MSDPQPGQFDFSQQRRTFRLELLRSVPQGVVETAAGTFAVFIAIQVFGLDAWMKGMIISSGSVGLLLSLFIVQLIRRIGCSVNLIAALLWGLSSLGFVVAALSSGSSTMYLTGICTAFIFLASGSPLMAQIYRKHYTNEQRGSLFSRTALLRGCIAASAGWLLGLWIKHQGFPPLFFTYAAGTIAMAGCVLAMAPVKLKLSNRIVWFEAFRHAGENQAFRKLLVVWMLLGSGNLISWALFVEYISNPVYGFGFDAEKTGLITTTIPMLAFLLTVVPWGSVFDRLPFYRVRALVNLFFIAGILIYYLGGGFIGLCVGIALHGIARSGGNILWTLWTTRFADEENVGEYQSVHSFLTGVRGVFAPLVGFTAIEWLGPTPVAYTSAGLIILGTLMIAPEIKDEFQATKKPA